MSTNDDKKKYRDMAMKAFFFLEKFDEVADKRTHDALTKCISSILPQGKLYRYRSNQKWEKYSKSIIEENKVYLCALEKQNDPFEFAFEDDFSRIAHQVPELMEGTDVISLNDALAHQEIWNEKSNEFFSYKAKMSIACFCEEKDNILLWAHYANCNKGFCIEYSAFDLLQNSQYYLLPVVYQDSFPVLPNINELDVLSPYRVAFERISTKSKIWSYEKEWRIIKYIEPKQNKTVNAHHNDLHYVNFPTPTSIYLGCNASKTLENRVLDICVKKRISLYKMTPDRHSYSLKDELIYSAPKG